MLLASWNFYKISKGCRSFNTGKVTSHQSLRMIWPRSNSKSGRLVRVWGHMADFFVRPPTLTTGNFRTIWSKDLKFSAIRDQNLFKKYAKYQEDSNILEVGFVLSKWPHLYGAYVVTMLFILILAVLLKNSSRIQIYKNCCKMNKKITIKLGNIVEEFITFTF